LDKKNKKAVALSYKAGDISPKVVARGQGFVAENIIKNAQEADVPIYEDKQLTEELSRLDIGQNIPPELYEVVAQVLVFVSDMDRMEAMKRYGK